MFEKFQGPNGIQGNSGETGDNGEEVSTYYLQIDDSIFFFNTQMDWLEAWPL